eukprot:COSAG02_NODE_62519_length_265_cov_1.530120_1_plen_35_part_01
MDSCMNSDDRFHREFQHWTEYETDSGGPDEYIYYY